MKAKLKFVKGNIGDDYFVIEVSDEPLLAESQFKSAVLRLPCYQYENIPCVVSLLKKIATAINEAPEVVVDEEGGDKG